jgi:hypothetical protein
LGEWVVRGGKAAEEGAAEMIPGSSRTEIVHSRKRAGGGEAEMEMEDSEQQLSSARVS